MDYAIIRVGGKQHRVRDGETLVVDRLRADEGGTFEPDVLLGDDGVKVTVTVLSHGRGPKIRIGKYRKRTGYKRHNGFRAATSRIEVSIGGKGAAAKKAEAPKAEAPEVEALEVEEAAPQVEEAAPQVESAPEPVAAVAAPAGLPDGYAELTVAAIGKEAKTWSRDELEAAQVYEQEHAARKGALSALASALAALEEDA
jgi:large subunit ribosomal protein L21